MEPERENSVWSALAWLVFPLVPALLGNTYYHTLNFTGFSNRGGPDPHLWGWFEWVLLGGPLLGYGFLAGATLGLPDETDRHRIRRWMGKRSVWVAVGPWIGFVVALALYYALWLVLSIVVWAYPPSQNWTGPSQSDWESTWAGWLLVRVLFIGVIAGLGYGWLVVAWVALRRARRVGRFVQSLISGLTVAAGFVGSLFGTFWALTEGWRSYFYDPRIVPALVAGAGLLVLAGCASETYGDVRRRDLFQALLLAWLLGLAMAWRWWGRSRSKK